LAKRWVTGQLAEKIRELLREDRADLAAGEP
jgi:hypothetical protein